jgi:hypothetical protein
VRRHLEAVWEVLRRGIEHGARLVLVHVHRPHQPILQRSGGDGIHLVFECLLDAKFVVIFGLRAGGLLTLVGLECVLRALVVGPRQISILFIFTC